MSRIENSTILITGAASGLGRGMAELMAEKGGRLVLWDVDPDGLEGTARAVRAKGGPEPAAFVCDLTRREEIHAVADRVRRDVGPVEILINNAGIVSGKPFIECTDEQIERTMQVNAMALFWTTRAFLPAMIERRRGHVVTIASSAGFVGVARLTDYCASKWAAVGFAESLRVEFRKDHKFLRSTVVCPYYINTGMFEGVKTRFPWLLPILDKDVVVRRIVRAIEKDRAQLVMPWLVRTVPLVKFLPPRAQDWIFDFLGINHSMDDFVGRR